jgi:hypothetical protein
MVTEDSIFHSLYGLTEELVASRQENAMGYGEQVTEVSAF